jgi:hypothetical protein
MADQPRNIEGSDVSAAPEPLEVDRDAPAPRTDPATLWWQWTRRGWYDFPPHVYR